MSMNNIIPLPRSFAVADGVFAVTAQTELQAASGTEFAAELLAASLNKLLTRQLRITAVAGDESGHIRLTIDPGAAPESYRLEIRPDGLRVSGDRAGVFYGVQSLLQMINVDIRHFFPKSVYQFNCCRIEDAPAYPWRGFMLDVARHFQSKAAILKLIEQLASYKINRLHLHLMDNFGWRVFLEHYPELVEYDPESWYNAGFYHPAELREIVDYAARYFIEVIPEIEMPAHSCNVFRSHPELSCIKDEPYKNNVYQYCLGNPETEEFLQAVISDLLHIFNKARYCHLGGDEADTRTWDNCPVCRQAIAERGLSGSSALEADFMHRITAFVQEKKVTPVLWAADYHPADGSILQAWRDDTLDELTTRGNQIVNSLHRFAYFDYPAREEEDHFDWMPSLPLKQVYEFEPAPLQLSPLQRSRIIGGEACLWTEKVPEEKLFSKTFPRLHAFSECVWSQREQRNWKDFKRRSLLHENSIFLQLQYSLNPIGPNAKLVDIARESNVSKTAVSLFINGKIERNKLAMETCARIATAIRSCQYRPSIHARAIQQKNSYLIGMAVPRSLDCGICREIQEGVQRVFDNDNYRLVPLFCDDTPDAVRKCMASLRACGVDAIMVFEDRLELLAELASEGKPVINLIFSAGSNLPSVTANLTAAGKLAAEKLADKRPGRIALIEPSPSRFFAPLVNAFAIRLRELRSQVEKVRTIAEIPPDCTRLLALSPEAVTEVRIAAAAGRNFETVALVAPGTENITFIDLGWTRLGAEAATRLLQLLRKSAPVSEESDEISVTQET